MKFGCSSASSVLFNNGDEISVTKGQFIQSVQTLVADGLNHSQLIFYKKLSHEIASIRDDTIAFKFELVIDTSIQRRLG